MPTGTRTVEINAQVFDLICRGAALDRIGVAAYLESIVMRDADYIRTREFLENPVRADSGDNRAQRLAA